MDLGSALCLPREGGFESMAVPTAKRLDCQSDLSASLTRLNPRSKLFLLREAPTTLLPKLLKAWNISHLVFEKDTDAYGRERDEEVTKLATDAGVKVVVRMGRTLYDPDQLVHINGGPTMSITQVQKAGAKIGKIAKPIPPPTYLPDPGDTDLSGIVQEKPLQTPDINAVHRDNEEFSYSHIAGPDGTFSVPTMAELGLKPATTKIRGGETIARQMLDDILANKTYTATFEKPNTAPTAFEPQSTTLLSPHLHFGSLSCREFYWRVQEVVDAFPGKASAPPTSLTGQLLFRDMYFAAQAPLSYTFGHTLGNPHCRFIPWHLPSEVLPSGTVNAEAYTVDSALAEIWFQRWKWGRTGFPWIDALMRQLRQEGWIHHLGRHAVACFLTRGGCYIDWARGANVFEEWLLDHEASCNIGNWQWLSCSAFYALYYRVYSPIAFPKKTDAEGRFVRRYVPELANYPVKYIYEPWKCPPGEQKRAGCLVEGDGKDDMGRWDSQGVEGQVPDTYPMPMFDFDERREVCLRKMKVAYKLGLMGDDARVKSGEWVALFEQAETESGEEGEVAKKKKKEKGGAAEPDGGTARPRAKRKLSAPTAPKAKQQSTLEAFRKKK
ncbi:MAG: hypothetical protein M1829_003462 [Trizodia sp. TS-e1964]|nr:MAG: hypothetical protein M1829_003462 [Trizodia sp. TS-e1964]